MAFLLVFAFFELLSADLGRVGGEETVFDTSTGEAFFAALDAVLVVFLPLGGGEAAAVAISFAESTFVAFFVFLVVLGSSLIAGDSCRPRFRSVAAAPRVLRLAGGDGVGTVSDLRFAGII